MSKQEMPAPLVSIKRHPVKWAVNTAVTGVFLLLFVHFGTLIVTGLYYLLFEVWKPLTEGWHELGPKVFGTTASSWDYTRHMLRDVGEGLLGGYLAQYVVWNHFKPKVQKTQAKALNIVDRFEIALRIPNLKNRARLSAWQYACAPLYGILYAAPGFAVAVLAVKGFHIHAPAEAVTHSYWQKVKAIDTGTYDKKIVGLGASLVLGRRPMKKVYDDAQLWFAERRLLLHKPLRFYHPPTFKARYNARAAQPLAVTGELHTGLQATVMTIGVAAAVALAGFGWYVLTYIA